jgi:hypothetical protein
MGTSLLLSWVPAGLLLAVAWLLAAWGLGRILRFGLFDAGREEAQAAGRLPEPAARDALALGLGIACMLACDSAFATAGLFRAGFGWRILAWALVLVPAGAGLMSRRTPRHGADGPRAQGGGPAVGLPKQPWWSGLRAWTLSWPALASLGVLVFAATLPPGIAWATEFGGYDALSYHLQLPKEWLEHGRALPLRDSVYSAFPGFIETATMHLWTMASFAPVHAVADAAQWLHAGIAVAAALVIGAFAASLLPADASERARRWATAIGTAGFLGIPWVVVTGSLAYNDLGPVLMLATAMLAWHGWGQHAPGRAGAVVGIALGAAIGCKLTAVGTVVLPFAAWAVASSPKTGARKLATGACIAAGFAASALGPWFLRNWIVVGNPLFPFAGNAPGWWDAEQLARFASGHAAPAGTGLGTRLAALWDQGFREGFGAAPDADPWLPQWGLAFGAGCAALAVAVARVPARGVPLALAFVAQCAFWMLATHLKARFLLPCAVPLCAAAGVAFAPRAAEPSRAARRATGALGTLLLLAWSAQPWLVLRMDPRMNDPNGPVANRAALGAAVADLGPGTKADADGCAADGSPMPLAWFANWRMPASGVLGCEGEADVFWCRTTPAWGTVWDGGPLARALRLHPLDARAAIAAMRADGITHLAVGEAMLARWKAAGWIDPALAPAAVRAVTARCRPVAPLVSGGVVYELPGPGTEVPAPVVQP